MAITRQMELTALTGLTVVPRAKFNRIKWDESQDPRHAFYRLYRYASEEDADDNVDATIFGPILETFFKDDDDLGHGEEFWYRVADVDRGDDEGDLSEPASLEARGVQAADIEPAAIMPSNLNAAVGGHNIEFDAGSLSLSVGDGVICQEITISFEASDVATTRYFSLTGHLVSTGSHTGTSTLYFDHEVLGSWFFGDDPSGTTNVTWRPGAADDHGMVQNVIGTTIAIGQTSEKFALRAKLASGAGSVKMRSLKVEHLGTSL